MKRILKGFVAVVLVCMTAFLFAGCSRGGHAEGPIEDNFSIENDYDGENPVAKTVSGNSAQYGK